MKGRPRHNVARQPNGQPHREQTHSPTEVRRLRDAALRGLRDPEWGSELGRLYLARHIDSAMYGAGKRWREEAARYMGSISEFPLKSATMERGKSMPPDPDSEGGREQARQDRDGAERFFEAHSALASVGHLAEKMVREVVENDLSLPGQVPIMVLRKGLDALVRHYGLTERANNARK